MHTVIDMIKALGGFSPTAPVQIGLVGPDDGLVVHEIAAIDVPSNPCSANSTSATSRSCSTRAARASRRPG